MAEVIHTLEVWIVTSNKYAAGTDNAIYFDIGPLGWKLPGTGASTDSEDPFSSDSHDHFTFTLPGIGLTTEDLVWLRVQKKGLGGFLGTPDFPDGDWHPESIQLVVNGAQYVKISINQWIDSLPNWSWMHVIRTSDTSEERFAHSLRLVPNETLGVISETVAYLTTPFKLLGVSGWLGLPLPIACAVGTVIRQPGRSTDGLATIDLQLKTVQFADRVFILDGNHEMKHTRYLRVEYQFRAPFLLPASEQYLPQNGEHVRICGEVKWDSDHEGWYEIHPRGPEDVQAFPTTLSVRKLLPPGFDPSKGIRSLQPDSTVISMKALLGA